MYNLYYNIIIYKLNISNVSCDSVLLFFFLSNFHDSCSFPLGNHFKWVLPEKPNIKLVPRENKNGLLLSVM